MNYGPLIGVILGAILATLGGFVAGRLTAVLERQRRAKLAALICAEVLISLENLSGEIATFHDRGDPFGTLTLRLIRSARREIEFYERNREATFELSNERLRARIHALMTRLAVPLDHIVDEANARHIGPGRTETTGDGDTLYSGMDEAYGSFRKSCELIAPMLDELYPMAHTVFGIRRVRSKKAASSG